MAYLGGNFAVGAVVGTQGNEGFSAVNPGLTIVAQALRVSDHIVDADLT